jgi:hypothetical protein
MKMMLHEYMVAMELRQKRLDWVNKNAWKFQERKWPIKKPSFQKPLPKTHACCA